MSSADYLPLVAPEVPFSSALEAEATLPPKGSLGSDHSTIEIDLLEVKLEQDAESRKESSSLPMSSASANPTFLVVPLSAVPAAGLWQS